MMSRMRMEHLDAVTVALILLANFMESESRIRVLTLNCWSARIFVYLISEPF
jgi:hypothetical protein